MRFARLSLAEIAKRRADAVRDQDLLEAGWMPDERTLAAAPFLTDYVETTYPGTGEPALYGTCTGHPRLADGPVMTSPILARGPGWIRTQGRFYRTGEPHPDPTRPAQDAFDELVSRLEAVSPPQPQPPSDPNTDPLDDYPSY
ncbi:hypothetical protein FV226_13220 [Methylobacterium sp. WL12]|uniref:DUF6634 family protein n=1 Tax=Methylobacterium sp. WL12 TaxID=2603890 RepID=UPI0011CB7001|nr:DUF6634 family protein [Methylobacterium sp. WL12]TXM72184.1 hypothetical protein FV226_13220 [Methylobacterium sp. WL12]